MAKDPQMLSGLQILEPYKDHPEAKQHIQAVWNYCSSVVSV